MKITIELPNHDTSTIEVEDPKTPKTNFERFKDSTEAFLAWVDEVYDISDPRSEYELEKESDDEVAQYLWHEIFGKDQLLDFLEWLFDNVNGNDNGKCK